MSLPVILCLHGHGTNGAIFKHQSRNIVSSLRSKFQFIFAESPIETPQPGIGVLPYFADVKPYRRWHHDAHAVGSLDVTADDVLLERRLVRSTLASLIEQYKPVGIMAFSQGTRVAAALCLDPELGKGIRFVVLICGFAGVLPLGDDEEEEKKEGGENEVMRILDIPSVQAQGLNDPWAAKGAKLAKQSVFDPARARTIKFRGGHDVPVAVADVGKITREILDVYESLP